MARHRRSVTSILEGVLPLPIARTHHVALVPVGLAGTPLRAFPACLAAPTPSAVMAGPPRAIRVPGEDRPRRAVGLTPLPPLQAVGIPRRSVRLQTGRLDRAAERARAELRPLLGCP